ncbi:MAG: cell division protein FtsQ/DivIB [Ilumatobacteraceae bacterium]
MADEPKTTPEGVPDAVLEELLAAFSAKEAGTIDFDDPSIDRILGIGDAAVPHTGVAENRVADVSEKSESSGVWKPMETEPTERAEPASAAEPATAVEPATAAEPAGAAAPNPMRKLIVIGDDDRPDALYLDEEAGSRLRQVHTAGDDSSEGRSTIVIKDLDESGSIEALPARSSGSMDPRVRARRIAVRRAKGRKRLIWVAIAAAILLVLVGAVAVLASSLFDVRTVDVQGAVYTDPKQLSAIVDGLRGKAILLVDTRQVERELESISWVESARVSTQFPHRVFIDIRERKPIATFAGSDGKYRVIDRDGRVLDVVDGIPIDYMLVTGANPDVDQGQFAGRPFASAAQLAIALPSEIRALTESIGVDATGGGLSLQLHGGIAVQLGPSVDLSAKLVRLLSEVRAGLDGICALDVSTTEITPTACK